MQKSPKARNSPSPLMSSRRGQTLASRRSLLASAREQLRGQALPDVSLAMAVSAQGRRQARRKRRRLLLLEDAAQKGNADAMFMVAQYYDPASTKPRAAVFLPISRRPSAGTIKPCKSGQPQAKAALDALKEQARALEAKGNAEARSLLQNWQ